MKLDGFKVCVIGAGHRRAGGGARIGAARCRCERAGTGPRNIGGRRRVADQPERVCRAARAWSGCGPACPRGAGPRSLPARLSRGEVLRLDLGTLESRDYYFVHRADLIEMLAEGAREAGARIRLLQKVASSVEGGAQPCVASGKRDARTEADLVIGADGLHSVMRPVLNGVSTPFFTRTGGMARDSAEPVGSRPRGAGAYGSDAPRGQLPVARMARLLNWWRCRNAPPGPQESWSQRDDPVALRAAFGISAPICGPCSTRSRRCICGGCSGTRWRRSGSAGGLALLGDAAHPTLPFMAQGASMALEDAWVLADALQDEATREAALDRYQGAPRGACGAGCRGRQPQRVEISSVLPAAEMGRAHRPARGRCSRPGAHDASVRLAIWA